MNRSYRNFIAGGIVLQLAMADVYFTLKVGMGPPWVGVSFCVRSSSP